LLNAESFRLLLATQKDKSEISRFDVKNVGGADEPLRASWQVNARLKYHFSPALAVSLGGWGIVGRQNRSYQDQFDVFGYSGSLQYDLNTTALKRSFQAFGPLAGVHLQQSFFRKGNIGISLTAGPIWVKYENRIETQLSQRLFWGDPTAMVYSRQTDISGAGRGIRTGLSGHISWCFGRSFGIILETGYSRCRLTLGECSALYSERLENVLASERTPVDGTDTTIQIMLQQMGTPMGLIQQDITDLQLDLSGFALQVGLQIRF